MKSQRARNGLSLAGNALALLALAALAAWLLHLQASPWPAVTPMARPRWLAAAVLALWLGLCGWTLWRAHTSHAPSSDGAPGWCVVYASQTGLALELAQRTVAMLRQAGDAAELRAIAEIDDAGLRGRRCLFVASTTGEGDPPDAALAFAGTTMAARVDLQGTRHAVLALGDRSYAQFCAFGHRLDAWLRGNGSQALFDLVEVDNADPGALRHWQHQLSVLAGRTDLPDWSRPDYRAWALAERRLLNPGSVGGPAFHLELLPPPGKTLQWQAGDIAEIGPRNAPHAVTNLLDISGLSGSTPVGFQNRRMSLADALACAHLPDGEVARGLDAQTLANRLQPLPHREYSIASIPANGRMELLVRLMRREGDQPGLGSGWLCTHAAIGSAIDLRIRANPSFHAPDPARPLILIGNGTGLAGLRAHMKARIAVGAYRNWLLFGERNAAHDAFHGDELDAWLREGKLTRLDRVYSRDDGAHPYVQDALRSHATTLLEWLDEGAAIYVCGSLHGMAPGVDRVLTDLLGQAGLESLLQSGRYRRDVY
jgi:sulfite reductase (NADPH) flavoprotein alpha-component